MGGRDFDGDDLPLGDMGLDDLFEEQAAACDPLDPDDDCFKPPAIPTEVHCLHCDREYESYLIEWRIERTIGGERIGFWCCPTPGCDGKGFGFDLMPTDPDYVGEDGERFYEEGEAFEPFGDNPSDPDDGACLDDESPFEERRDDDLPF
jgi:hypothetical protein